jgi:hypothetical protein
MNILQYFEYKIGKRKVILSETVGLQAFEFISRQYYGQTILIVLWFIVSVSCAFQILFPY